MLRLLVILTLAAVVAYFGSTVKLGERTFFGHIRAIWSTKEAQDMRKGLDEKAGPALDRMKRGVEAGIKAASGDEEAAAQDAGPDAQGDAALPEAAPLPAEESAAPGEDKALEKKAPDKKANDKKDTKKPEKSAWAPAPTALPRRLELSEASAT